MTWLAIRDVVRAKESRLDPHVRIEDELLLCQGRWYIPDNIHLKTMILQDNTIVR